MLREKECRKLLSFAINRSVKKLFKNYLSLLTEIQQRHLKTIHTLQKNNVNQETVDEVNFLNLEDYGLYRKRVLDDGNDTIRDLENILDEFRLVVKLEKDIKNEQEIESKKEKQ